jgi:hypothetical protein
VETTVGALVDFKLADGSGDDAAEVEALAADAGVRECAFENGLSPEVLVKE